jgi:amino acid transporter
MPKSLKSYLIGRPLTYQEQSHERLGRIQALAIFSSDALSSVAYATEAILIELAFLGSVALDWSLPVALAITALLIILLVSYRQTIFAYPSGGGAYIVSKDNLGEMSGLTAGAALLLDYLLTVSVSVSAGVEAITSAFPGMNPHRIALCILSVWLIVLGNLRGLRESGKIFAVPTYVFVFSILTLIGVGAYQFFNGTLVQAPVASALQFHYPAIGLFMVLKAFSAGCTALTGVEAVSNGVPAFRKPESKNAVTTLIWMVALLGFMFVGITFLAHILHIMPKEDETVLSQIARAIFGTGITYYVIQFSTMGILILAANTAFADFPRLASLLAIDRYLPRQLASVGDRLVFSNGILALGFFASLLIILFNGDTHLLLPLYAVGVFISFTLSQSGMVMKFYREKPKGWHLPASLNLVGAATTFLVLMVITITRFFHGAWIVVLIIPLIVLMFKKIHGHYFSLIPQLSTTREDFVAIAQPLNFLVIVPVSGIHKGMVRALRFAYTLSENVIAVSVDINPDFTKRLQKNWDELAPEVPLVILPSPFRSLSEPLLSYISERIGEARRSEREVVLLVPEFVTARWWQNFLHNQTALILRTYLWIRYPELVITSVRHRLRY